MNVYTFRILTILTSLTMYSIRHEVRVAINQHARAPRVNDLPVRTVRFSGHALTSFVEEHSVNNVVVRVYSPAKTVADCFKFRNKMGPDIAIEALRDCLRQRKASPDEIWKAAKVCRVTSVIKPYLEALI